MSALGLLYCIRGSHTKPLHELHLLTCWPRGSAGPARVRQRGAAGADARDQEAPQSAAALLTQVGDIVAEALIGSESVAAIWAGTVIAVQLPEPQCLASQILAAASLELSEHMAFIMHHREYFICMQCTCPQTVR